MILVFLYIQTYLWHFIKPTYNNPKQWCGRVLPSEEASSWKVEAYSISHTFNFKSSYPTFRHSHLIGVRRQNKLVIRREVRSLKLVNEELGEQSASVLLLRDYADTATPSGDGAGIHPVSSASTHFRKSTQFRKATSLIHCTLRRWTLKIVDCEITPWWLTLWKYIYPLFNWIFISTNYLNYFHTFSEKWNFYQHHQVVV